MPVADVVAHPHSRGRKSMNSGEMVHLDRPWTVARETGHLVVVLVRHGQTEWNAAGRFLGRSDIPLDAVGVQQARSLGAALPGRFDVAYTSPLCRASRTAELVWGAAIPEPDLQELSQGELEGLTGAEAFSRYTDFFSAWKQDPADVVVPGGESLRALQRRALAVLERIAERHGHGQVVAAFSHQMVIASLTCAATGDPLARWRDHRVPNASMTVLERVGGGWRLVCSGVHVESAGD